MNSKIHSMKILFISFIIFIQCNKQTENEASVEAADDSMNIGYENTDNNQNTDNSRPYIPSSTNNSTVTSSITTSTITIVNDNQNDGGVNSIDDVQSSNNDDSNIQIDPDRYIKEIFNKVEITKDIVFAEVKNSQNKTKKLRLDLFQPKGDTLSKRPAIMFMIGGGFVTCNKSSMTSMATTFAKRGYVTISIEYRTNANAGSQNILSNEEFGNKVILDAQHDAQAGIRWLRANATKYKIDQDTIIAAGASAGGVLALQVTYNYEDTGDSGNAGYSSNTSAAVSLKGALLDPLHLMLAGDPPLIMFHGTKDTTVPYSLAVATKERAEALQIPIEFYPYEGGGHNAVQIDDPDIIKKTALFLASKVLQISVPIE